MKDLKVSIDKAADWLLFSGIQSGGGFNAWYDLDSGSYPYTYSEITGYGISALICLNDQKKDGLFISRARDAADWLIKHALHGCGGVLTRHYLKSELNNPDYSFDSKIIYAFDTGMVLFGIANLFKKTGETKYFKTAEKMGNFLLSMQRGDGLFEPIYDVKRGEFINTDEKWSTQSGSFHAKLSLGLLVLYDITNDKKFKDAVIKLCDASLRFQQANGRFISFRNTGATHTHPHCYGCEGVYYAGKKLGDQKYIAAAAKGTLWSLNNQLSDGGMPCIYDKNTGLNRNQRSDTLAQVLRMAVYFLNDGLDAVKKYRPNINRLASKLMSFQKMGDEQAGGFYYGYTEDGKKMNHINSWCSMFALQAIWMYFDLLNNKKLKPDYLI